MRKRHTMPTRVAAVISAVVLLSACGTSSAQESAGNNAWASAFEAADMSGYSALAEYEEPLQFVDMTVADIDRLMKAGETFAFFASFSECPWCNVVVRNVNDAAREAGVNVGNLNTRKDPSWESNLDIDDYDLFVDDFGAFLDVDEEDLPHLYVPHFFCLRNGEVVYEHEGALPEMGDNPNMELTETQQDSLTDIFREGFRAMLE